MRIKAWSIGAVVGLGIIGLLLHWPGQPAGPSPAITSVLRLRNTTLAMTRLGLFEADSSTQRWRRITVPQMPFDGHFARCSPDSTEIYYAAPLSGLWRSRDQGHTWDNAVPGGTFNDLLLAGTGELFAIDKTALYHLVDGRWIRSSMLVDPSGHLIESQVKPGLVAVRFDRSAKLVLKNYWMWETDQWGTWQNEHPNFLFEPEEAGTPALPRLKPTLDNYFTLAFGNRTELSPLTLTPAQKSYRFPREGARPVDIALRYRGPGQLTLCDEPQGLAMYEVKAIGDNGQWQWFRGWTLRRPSDWDELRKRARAGDPSVLVTLDARHPHHRTLDLADCPLFKNPGHYRVQVIFDNRALGAPSSCRFSGEVFEVVVE